MNAQASIGLDHVDKILGKAKRVDDLSLELAAGKIYGLLGPNGSGKTTILHLICGLYKRTAARSACWGWILCVTTKRCAAPLACCPRAQRSIRSFRREKICAFTRRSICRRAQTRKRASVKFCGSWIWKRGRMSR